VTKESCQLSLYVSCATLLSGTGQIWFKDVNFEIVDDSVPETGPNKGEIIKVISFEKEQKQLLMKLRK
jgi:hypothetical protein